MIGVFIVAASADSRARLRADLAESGFEVVGSAAELVSLDEVLPDTEPDVLVVERGRDVSENNYAELADLAERSRLILLADGSDQTQLARMFREGALAVLPREASASQLRAAIQAVAAGLLVAHPSSFSSLLPAPRLPVSAPSARLEPLTKREREVLQMLAAGLANKEIAARLAISEHTAKFHVASILGKLGAATRAEAVAIGLRSGIILL